MAQPQSLPGNQSAIGKRVKELKIEQCRLMILQILEEASGHSADATLLHQALIEFSHHISFDRLHTDLAWLEEQGVVRLEHDTLGQEKICIITLTQRGSDVAYGRALIPGIRRPGRKI